MNNLLICLKTLFSSGKIVLNMYDPVLRHNYCTGPDFVSEFAFLPQAGIVDFGFLNPQSQIHNRVPIYRDELGEANPQ
jgi:hypothetical protein